MKCDNCDNEAVVHEVVIKGGKKIEKHLCQQCAKGEGVVIQAVQTPITKLLSQYIAAQGAASKSEAAACCPACGTTYGQFRHAGVLGCPLCYQAFEAQLSPLLQRAHEGGTHHVGKAPIRRPQRPPAPGHPSSPAHAATGEQPPPAAKPVVDDIERRQRVAMLRKRLEQAVSLEQYEKAARLRDEIRAWESGQAPQRSSPDDPPASDPGGATP